jgi:hypothetical protein
MSRLLKNWFFPRMLKNAHMQGSSFDKLRINSILRSEAYLQVRCNDEG